MTDYRRSKVPGAIWFCTVNCAERRYNRLLTDRIEDLRTAFRKVGKARPFEIQAIVVLPKHLHCIWTLPQDDVGFQTRWALIKADFSRAVPGGERRSESRGERGEQGIWQRRFWEHMIRDAEDLRPAHG